MSLVGTVGRPGRCEGGLSDLTVEHTDDGSDGAWFWLHSEGMFGVEGDKCLGSMELNVSVWIEYACW